MEITEKIWLEYHKKLATFIKSRTNEDVAEDLLQEVFVKIHNKIDSLNENTRLVSWLFRITRNTIIDHYRSKRPTEELPEWVEQLESDEDDVITKELSFCLKPMVKELPDKYRKAIQFSDFENKTQKEVAQLEGISLSGAKSRVQRGRALLKSMLHNCCQIEINKYNQLVSYEKKNRNCKYC
ncbi:MAG: RNA polymerase sigma factor SigZ [Gammaproteobacteria bacterium]|nr:RNA polymerase sigma factor SigZ [Gammaproteobacteria bacterium]